MHETEQQLSALQSMLDISYESAGEHLKSTLPASHRLDAGEVCRLLKGVCISDLATVNSKNQPFAAPVDGVFLQGQFWFGSAHHSLRFKHIRRNAAVSVAITRGQDYSILIHGEANEVDTSSGKFEHLHDYFIEVYGDKYDDMGYWGSAPFAWIEPRKMFATVFNQEILNKREN